MAYTNFCCRSGGSNLNAGTRTGNTTEPGTSADLTYASGNWVQATRVFTVASGDPAADGVAVGDFVSVYADGSTVTSYISRVTARDATTITTSATILAGTAPSDGTGNRTLKVGGAWLGPNGAEDFPFDLATLHTLRIDNDNQVRINLKNDATYAITASITPSSPAAALYIQGYTSAYADGGRFLIDGGTSGASYQLFINTTFWYFIDGEFSNNGATGNAGGVGTGHYRNIVVHDIRGVGIISPGSVVECEIYACGKNNTGTHSGISTAGRTPIIRTFIHDNTGSNISGIFVIGSTEGPILIDSVIESNGLDGVFFSNNGNFLLAKNTDFYNNGRHGINFTRTASGIPFYVENCNFIKNGGWGITVAVTGVIQGIIRKCGFGSGTQANTSGTTTGLQAIQEIDSVTYAANVTPWVDPANGDFRIDLAAAQGTGRGSYTQTASSYTGTIGYPDIGAAQHLDSGGGGSSQHAATFVG